MDDFPSPPDGSSAPADEPTPAASAAIPLSGAQEGFGFSGVAGEPPEVPVGTDLGGVTIVRLIAEGGMGTVYEGVQSAPRRTVAVKVVHGDGLASELLERFSREAELLARLRHPRIAQIHTFGSHGAVRFFIMEMVDGARSITHYVADGRLSIRDRVALFHTVCDAVAHGHSLGIIHRDLKPGNILVDRRGDPKVIDFGVARCLDAPVERRGAGRVPDAGARSPGVTAAGEIVGTLQYMSPEQLTGDAAAVDARSDVYALGLVLHEIVVGSLPYDLRDATVAEAARIVGGDAAPATAAVAHAAAVSCRGDDARNLAVIVAKCLERAASDRYASAAELQADLGRWLDSRPILARPPTPLESARRFARRHRVATLATCAAAASVLAALIGISAFSVRADRQRRRADEARAAADRDRHESLQQASRARSQLYFSNVLLAAEARDRDNIAESRRLLESARSLVADAGSPRPIELECLAASLDDAIRVLPGEDGTVTAVAWSPRGDALATGHAGGIVRLRSSGAMLPEGAGESMDRTFEGHGGPVWSVAFSPNGRWLASASADGSCVIRQVDDGSVVRRISAHAAAVYSAAFSPGGDELLTASRDRTARVWDVATGRQRLVLEGHGGTVYSACTAADGALVATAGLDGTVRLWEATTGGERAVLHGHEDRVFDVAFSQDGRSIATASEDGTARLWDVATARERGRFKHPFRVNAVAFVGAGTRLATASGDGVLRIWDPETGIESARLRGHTGPLWSIAGLAGTSRLATGAVDGTARIWDADRAMAAELPADSQVLAATYAPDGGLLAVALAAGRVQLWDTACWKRRGEFACTAGRVNAIACAPSGDRFVGGCDEGVACIWSPTAREPLAEYRIHDKRIYAAVFSPDGATCATAAEDRTARLWDPASGVERVAALRHPRRVFSAMFSPDGRIVATACEDRLVRLWDARDGRELRQFAGHEGAVNWATFSPDGRRIASASSDGTVRLWRVSDGQVLAVLTGPSRQIWKVAFSPDATRVAAVSADGTAQLWDAASGRAALMLRGHADQVWAVAFAPGGGSLVTGSWDGTARLWGISPADIARQRGGWGSADR